ncbi:TPA: hypothetical protein RXL09_001809 [Escherichia coli]|nr:hypothetical protein [Escherichia coli]
MESNIKGLVAAGHEMASELKAECGAVDMRSVAKLISDLATQLEVQLVRANALAEDHQRATESIKQADSAVKLAHEKFSALAAENAGLKDVESNLVRNIINDLGDTEFQYEKVQTPATDAFLAEVRAQERTDFIGRIEWIIRNECNPIIICIQLSGIKWLKQRPANCRGEYCSVRPGERQCCP